MRKLLKKRFFLILIFIFIIINLKYQIFAEEFIEIPTFDFNLSTSNDTKEVASSLQLLFILTIIILAPSILIMMTCFTRVIIGMHFLRSALGTQQMPPNQILIGVALFLTFFINGNIFIEVNENAIKPYSQGLINQQEAIEISMKPFRKFMMDQVENEDVGLFLRLSGQEIEQKEEIPNRVLIPAFILGEMTKGFKFGVILYIPFIVVDMIVSSILMAMGMMMLPPAMISMPFKILIFMLSGGWNLVIENMIKTFRNI